MTQKLLLCCENLVIFSIVLPWKHFPYFPLCWSESPLPSLPLLPSQAFGSAVGRKNWSQVALFQFYPLKPKKGLCPPRCWPWLGLFISSQTQYTLEGKILWFPAVNNSCLLFFQGGKSNIYQELRAGEENTVNEQSGGLVPEYRPVDKQDWVHLKGPETDRALFMASKLSHALSTHVYSLFTLLFRSKFQNTQKHQHNPATHPLLPCFAYFCLSEGHRHPGT